jgi:hypothetical protein
MNFDYHKIFFVWHAYFKWNSKNNNLTTDTRGTANIKLSNKKYFTNSIEYIQIVLFHI